MPVGLHHVLGHYQHAFVLPAWALVVGLGVAIAALPVSPATAQGLAENPEDMTAEEKAERESRKECKVAICAVIHNRKPGADVSCKIEKSWRKEQLDKIVGKAGVSWPWGTVKCTVPVVLKRDMLAKMLDGSKHDAEIGKQQLHCVLEHKEGKSDIKAEFTPKVSFEGGKATKAVLNWGPIEAPTLVKGAMWTATATDNTFNVLQSMIVNDINGFTGGTCEEVKADWKDK